MTTETIKLIITLSMAFLAMMGMAVLWTTRMYRVRLSRSRLARPLLLLAGWTMLVLGLLADPLMMPFLDASGAVFAVIAVLLVLVGAAWLLASWMRYRNDERESLFWMFGTAAAAGLPAEKPAQAFAVDRHDSLGRRGAELAMRLQRGDDLLTSLSRSGLRPGVDVVTALVVSQQIGGLSDYLGSSLGSAEAWNRQLRRLAMRMGYLVVVAVAMILPTFFLLRNVTPVLQSIVADSGVNLPTISSQFFQNQALTVPLGLVALFGFIVVVPTALLVMTLTGLNLLDADVIGLTTLMRPLDEARVLRALGWSAARQATFLETMGHLAKNYPKQSVGTRLASATMLVHRGMDWKVAMQRASFMTTAEAAVAASAERTGNLAWALQELADRRVARMVRRLQFWQSLCFPLAVVLTGSFVLLVAVAYVAPICHVIEVLSR